MISEKQFGDPFLGPALCHDLFVRTVLWNGSPISLQFSSKSCQLGDSLKRQKHKVGFFQLFIFFSHEVWLFWSQKIWQPYLPKQTFQVLPKPPPDDRKLAE